MGDGLDLAAVYTDLHANPELGFRETRTAEWSPRTSLRQASM